MNLQVLRRGGAGLAIPNGISDERKLTAAKFIDFMTNTDNTITFTQATGYMPVRKDAMEKPEEKKFLEENPNAMTAIKQLNENTQPQDAARVFVSGGGQRAISRATRPRSARALRRTSACRGLPPPAGQALLSASKSLDP
mgnify:CR=1 FL=1